SRRNTREMMRCVAMASEAPPTPTTPIPAMTNASTLLFSPRGPGASAGVGGPTGPTFTTGPSLSPNRTVTRRFCSPSRTISVCSTGGLTRAHEAYRVLSGVQRDRLATELVLLAVDEDLHVGEVPPGAVARALATTASHPFDGSPSQSANPV